MDAGIVVAASRAGGTGLLDIGMDADLEKLNAALAHIRGKAAAGGWGLRWDAQFSSVTSVVELERLVDGRIDVLIVAGIQREDAAAIRESAGRFVRFVALEVHDLESALAAQDAGYDGVVVKGNETGGRIGKSSSFILLQEFSGALRIPFWIQGGIGPRSAAAATLAGAAGVVLAEQLWLTEEGPYGAPALAASWSRLDGGETVVVGERSTMARLSSRHGRQKLRALERAVAAGEDWPALLRRSLQDDDDPVALLGQDIAFAGAFARRWGTTGRAVAAIAEALESGAPSGLDDLLSEGSDLATIHGVRYPIVQGPMTRVSDVAPFARAVADGGALPFLALSVLRGPQAHALLSQTKAIMGEKPWGVGMLGFAPLELRQEQIDAISEAKPPFAIIAGGRPSQARELEALGVSTYLHVPSPGLLEGFLKEGARKFIFEGGECGGHTGPRASFVLWESAIEILADVKIADPRSVQILFAGGVHDALSAAMVARLAAPLAARGMKIGVLMGTAYLFTHEAVSAGAILEEFQHQALRCDETALLQSGVGIYTRCARTSFCGEFDETRRRLIREEKSDEQILMTLELLNVGRLRIASKGLAHKGERTGLDESGRYIELDVEAQRRDGLYMMGEVARLRRATLGVAELHEEVSRGAAELLAKHRAAAEPARVAKEKGEDIAIVGMACVMPGAEDARAFWRNIVQSICMFREVSEDRWRPSDFFDTARAPDRIYSKWGAFLDEIAFDPTAYGIPPASLPSIEPVQLLALHVATKALADAGFDRRPFPKDRTATIFASGAMNELGTLYVFRTLLSHYLPKVAGLSEETRAHIVSSLYGSQLPQWTPDSFPGFLANVAAGRVSNRLDLRGANFTVDAACSSSLAALDAGIRELQSHDADVALIGGIDGANGCMAFMSFAQTHALSPTGVCRPFSDTADGIVLGEGVAAIVLKRLSDAERDGDRIYAVVKGVGSSSDGRNRSLTAPDNRGQALALQRAYEKAGVDPASVALIEAHGTGTVVGDKCEIKSMTQVFGEAGAERQSCAVGSVKSMIGHTKVTAGLAALVKASLALKHRVLPPTLGVDKPSSRVDFAQTPFYVNTRARPWFARSPDEPRRCGVSAFGFGGTNFHAVLEEYAGGYRESDVENFTPRAAELIVVTRADGAEVERAAQSLLASLVHPDLLSLGQLAYSLHLDEQALRLPAGEPVSRLAIVATSVEDLKSKLEFFLRQGKGKRTIKAPQGIYFHDRGAEEAGGGVCMLFPGQGSQKLDMLSDLVLSRPSSFGLFERADSAFAGELPQPLSRYIYPLPSFTEEERERRKAELDDTRIAQPALGLADLTAYDILAEFGLAPDFVAGHSYGEYVALCVAGAISRDDLLRLSQIRGLLSAEAAAADGGTMAAIAADEARVAQAIRALGLEVAIANLNAPDQTIVAGGGAAIDRAVEAFREQGLRAKRLPVTAAFHCAAMAPAQARLAAQLSKIAFAAPKLPVYSNTTASPYPSEAPEIEALLARHIAEPLRFVEEIERLYEAGARVFIEAGPGMTLSGLVDRILGKRPHATLAVDAPERPGWLQFGHLLAQAITLGLPVDVAQWFRHRGFAEIRLDALFEKAEAAANPPASVWRVSGGKAVPWRRPASTAEKEPAPEPIRIPSEKPPAPVAVNGASGPKKPTEPNGVAATPILHRRRETVNEGEPKSGDPAPAAARPRGSPLTQMRSELTQLIELQREQQVTLQRYIALQERLLSGADAGSASYVEQAPELARFEAPQRAEPIAPAPTAPHRLLTPSVPVPVLPEAVFAAVDGAAIRPATPAAEAPPRANGAAALKAEGAPTEMPPTAQFKAELLATMIERTGYSAEMLDFDAHMEADLGVDSIKRIEIFNQLKDRFPFMEGQDEETIFDELAGLKTLNAVVEWYDGLQARRAGTEGTDPAKKSPAPSSLSPLGTVESNSRSAGSEETLRYVLSPLPAPRAARASEMDGYPYERVILVVGEATPVAEALDAALKARGYQVWRALPGDQTTTLATDAMTIDFADPEGVKALATRLAEGRHRVGALFNLAGLDAECVDDRRRLDCARNLFQLLKTFEGDLKDSAGRGGGWLVNVTALDGQFGLRRQQRFSAAVAGSLGVAKSAAQEWRDLRVRCIDVDPHLAADKIARELMIEAGLRASPLEIGLTEDGRWTLDLAQASAAAAEIESLRLDPEAVVLATGGAYGITADIARAVASAYRPRLVLVGRSPAPAAEPEETRRLSASELKEFLIGRLRAENPKVKPVEIERVWKRMLKDRQILANLEAMTSAGARVEYHSLDITDADAFGRLIDDVYARFGRIDGVLHGAGVLDDRLIRDKTLDSFDRVFATKATPAFTLIEKLRPEGLRFLLFFSSIAGRFGNAGQSDYSAANEVLNKLASRLSLEWPKTHVVAINWGPWNGGMVTDELRRLYESKDIRTLEIEQGRQECLDELARGATGNPEIVVAASMQKIAQLALRQ
ncbi:type I polyketide synthase [Methylosinus sp. H3A]|uniref:type I polyketide synthase n=1 Tax=Methylosinus sp. H3A TaxID=2785786 RepID=UPI001FF01398|nr:type I polyketide synthase [Methylosinus sp. H3A]